MMLGYQFICVDMDDLDGIELGKLYADRRPPCHVVKYFQAAGFDTTRCNSIHGHQ